MITVNQLIACSKPTVTGQLCLSVGSKNRTLFLSGPSSSLISRSMATIKNNHHHNSHIGRKLKVGNGAGLNTSIDKHDTQRDLQNQIRNDDDSRSAVDTGLNIDMGDSQIDLATLKRKPVDKKIRYSGIGASDNNGGSNRQVTAGSTTLFNLADSVKKNLNKTTTLSSSSIKGKNKDKQASFEQPMGYPYFANLFKSELVILKKLIEKRKITNTLQDSDFQLFRKLIKFDKSIKDKDKNILLLTTLKRNPNYLEHFLSVECGIDLKKYRNDDLISDDVETDAFGHIDRDNGSSFDEKSATSTTFGQALKLDNDKLSLSGTGNEKRRLELSDNKPGQHGTFGDILSKAKTTSSNEINSPAIGTSSTTTTRPHNTGSFNDFLASLNKLQRLSTGNNPLPKMTDMTPMPTLERSFHSKHLDSLQIEMDAKKFEDFLITAKSEYDAKENQMFKSELNYEWSKEQLIEDPKTLENRNFFTPILIPKTIIPSKLFLRKANNISDLKIDLFPTTNDNHHYSKDDGLNNFEFIVLFKDASMKKLKTYDPNNNNLIKSDSLHKKNIFSLMSNLKSPELYLKNINRLFNKKWELLDGDSDKLVFIRNKKFRIWYSFKNIMAIVGVLSLTLGLLSYVLKIEDIELMEWALNEGRLIKDSERLLAFKESDKTV